jgi:hypothetical protein
MEVQRLPKNNKKRRTSNPAAANHHRWTGATPRNAVAGYGGRQQSSKASRAFL